MEKIQSDLITIFPRIVLETEEYEYGKKVPDKRLKSFFKYNNCIVCSYLYLQKHPKTFNKITRKRIDSVKKQILDKDKNEITDFTIVIEKNADTSSYTGQGENLLLFFANQVYLNIIPDTIKIISYYKYGRELILNDERIMSLDKEILYVVPTDDYKNKIRIWEKDLILVKCIEKLDQKKPNLKKVVDRIFNSLALFNQSIKISYTNPKASIVLMVSAFESVLELPRQSKTENFVQSIKLILNFSSYIENWAREIYDLRSNIVHGEPKDSSCLLIGNYKHGPHLEIAQEAFRLCFYKILEKHRILAVGRKYEWNKVKELTNKIVPNKDKVDKIIISKKFSYKSFQKNKKFYIEFINNLEALTATDYSATKEFPQLLNLIVSICKEWSAIEIEVIKTKIPTITDPRLKDYYKLNKTTLNKILKKLDEIKKNKLSSFKEKRLYDSQRMELTKLNNYLYPVFHNKAEYKMTLPEFISRSFSSLWAITI